MAKYNNEPSNFRISDQEFCIGYCEAFDPLDWCCMRQDIDNYKGELGYIFEGYYGNYLHCSADCPKLRKLHMAQLSASRKPSKVDKAIFDDFYNPELPL